MPTTTEKPTGSTAKMAPAYVAFETFRNFIQSLHQTAVPDHIGKGLMPNLSNGTQSHLLVALKFLRLIGSDGATTNEMRELVRGFGTDKWAAALASVLLVAYAPIVGDLNIANTTDEKLEKAFKDKSSLESTVLDRAVRFYLKGMREAKLTLSPHLGKRKPRRPNKTAGNKPPRTKEVKNDESDGNAGNGSGNGTNATGTLPPEGMIDFPIPIGNAPSFIRVPKGITMNQFPMVKAIADVIEELAKQNTPQPK